MALSTAPPVNSEFCFNYIFNNQGGGTYIETNSTPCSLITSCSPPGQFSNRTDNLEDLKLSAPGACYYAGDKNREVQATYELLTRGKIGHCCRRVHLWYGLSSKCTVRYERGLCCRP